MMKSFLFSLIATSTLGFSGFASAAEPELSNNMTCKQARSYGAVNGQISYSYKSGEGRRFVTAYFFSNVTYPSCPGLQMYVPSRDQELCHVGCVPQIPETGGRSGGR